jgi:hypothetical protein
MTVAIRVLRRRQMSRTSRYLVGRFSAGFLTVEASIR